MKKTLLILILALSSLSLWSQTYKFDSLSSYSVQGEFTAPIQGSITFYKEDGVDFARVFLTEFVVYRFMGEADTTIGVTGATLVKQFAIELVDTIAVRITKRYVNKVLQSVGFYDDREETKSLIILYIKQEDNIVSTQPHE